MRLARRVALVSFVSLAGCAHSGGPLDDGACDEPAFRRAIKEGDWYAAEGQSAKPACPPSLAVELRRARERTCEAQVNAAISFGEPGRAADIVKRSPCTPEVVARANAAAAGHSSSAGGAQAEGRRRCDEALAGANCPDELERGEALERERLKALVTKDACLRARNNKGTERAVCREHLAEALRARRWSEAAADLEQLPSPKDDVLPTLVAGLREAQPREEVPGLPSLRAAELAQEALALRFRSPWASAFAATLARRAGYAWDLPPPAADYAQLEKVRTQPVELVFTMFGKNYDRPWRVNWASTTVQDTVHVDGYAMETTSQHADSAGTYTITGTTRVEAHERSTGKTHAEISGVTFFGAYGYPTVTVPLPKRVRTSSEADSGFVAKAWPEVRARWLDEQARAARTAMSRAPTDELRLEAAVKVLVAGAEDARARAVVEKRFGPMP